jgi:hypothetical protein
MSAFGSGPSNGQFWYGSSTNFPGFLYKKNVGVGGRRSTKMNPGGNILTVEKGLGTICFFPSFLLSLTLTLFY